MRKTIIGLLIGTFLLGTGGMINVYASSGTGSTTIGYTADASSIKMEITGEAEVIKGTTGHPYHLSGDGNETSAIWSIKGATSKNTKIDAGGFLTIGVDETADEIKIIGYSVENPDRFAEYTVKLVEKTYTIVDIEQKNDITMPYGTTEDQLLSKLDEDNIFDVTVKTNDGKTYVISVGEGVLYSDEAVVQENGVLLPGTFKLNYELTLPFIQIDYDETIVTDKNKDTNIIGDAMTYIMVTIQEADKPIVKPDDKPTVKPDEPTIKPSTDNNKPISGTISGPNTGDETNMIPYLLGMAALPLAMILLMFKRKRDDKEESV